MEGTIAGANWDGLKYIMYAIYIYIYIYNYLYIDIIYIDIIYICIYVYIYIHQFCGINNNLPIILMFTTVQKAFDP